MRNYQSSSACPAIQANSMCCKETSVRRLKAALLFGIGLLPFSAYANAGTPLMWAGMLHLVFGNALIGLGEGLLIAWLFKAQKRSAIPAMIGANYLSAWLGGLFLTDFMAQRLDLHLYNALPWIWGMVGLTYLFTLTLEWPFVAYCLRKLPGWPRKSIIASLIAQTISYTVLFVWYSGAGRHTLFTKLGIVPLSNMTAVDNSRVYYISKWEGDVYSMRLDGADHQKFLPLHSQGKSDSLVVSRTSSERWNLLACVDKGTSRGQMILLASNLASRTTENWKADKSEAGNSNTSVDFGQVPILHASNTNVWIFETDFYAMGGLEGKNTNTGEEFRFALETPFIQWPIRHATQLPNDQVVFQLGQDQICLLDPATKQIALLARGRGPVVVLEK